MNRNINIRTILVITSALSSLVVIRQNLFTQLIVLVIALILLLLQDERKNLFDKLFGRMKRLWMAVISIMVLQILFRRDGDAIFSFLFIKITDLGLLYGISVSLRLINLILITGLLFSFSSSEYLLAFKAWHIPFEISFLITTVIRFIPDYYKLFTAYRETVYLRNINLKTLSIKGKLTALTSLLIPVLTNNLSEVKQRAIALDLKGFRFFPTRTYLYESKLKTHDYIIQIITIFLFIIIVTI